MGDNIFIITAICIKYSELYVLAIVALFQLYKYNCFHTFIGKNQYSILYFCF